MNRHDTLPPQFFTCWLSGISVLFYRLKCIHINVNVINITYACFCMCVQPRQRNFVRRGFWCSDCVFQFPSFSVKHYNLKTYHIMLLYNLLPNTYIISHTLTIVRTNSFALKLTKEVKHYIEVLLLQVLPSN